MSDDLELQAALEAILFASTEPVSRSRLAEVFSRREADAVAAALEAVLERYAADPEARGIQIEEVAGGLRLVTRPELHGHLRAYFDVSGQNRLSMAALETLAIVAYRQPITGPEIQDLRGVNSSGVLKTLLDRRMIRIAGRRQVVGKPFEYRTTREFLMHFGLAALSDLPPLEEFEESFGALETEPREVETESAAIDEDPPGAPDAPDEDESADPESPSEPAEPDPKSAEDTPPDVGPSDEGDAPREATDRPV